MRFSKQQFVAIQYRAIFYLSCLFAIASCSTFSQDGGFTDVQRTTQRYIKQTPVWANSEALKNANSSQVKTLLKEPLSTEDAVQIALLNNPQLQADFYQLQIAEAEVVQAGRLPNPSFSMLYTKNNGDYTIEKILSINVLALFTLPKATDIEKQHFAAMQNKVVLKILNLAQQTRNAYINALAANENVHYLSQVNHSAQATYAFAKRMREAGNWNELDASREQSFYTETTLDLKIAENQCLQAEETLTRLLGLLHPSDFKLPEHLTDLPATSDSLKKIKSDDFSKRLDLQQIRLNYEGLAMQLGLVKATRFVNVLEIGPASVLEGKRGDPTKKGFELRFELPIFDWGTSKVKRAEAIYQQAINEASQQAIAAASEVRSEYGKYETNYEIAKRYRDEIIPLKKRVLHESLLRYNGMLISPFELMVAAREQVLAVNRYIEALRDFWLAESDLDMALVGKPIDDKGL